MGKILKYLALIVLTALVVWSLFNVELILPFVMMAVPFLLLSLVVLAPLVLLIYIIFKLCGSSVGRVVLIILIIGIALFVITLRKKVMDLFEFDTLPPAATYQQFTPADTVTVDESFFEN